MIRPSTPTSRKAVAAGFDWDSVDSVWEQVQSEVEEFKATLDGQLALFPLVLTKAIPLIHGHDQRPSGFFDKACQVGILVGDILLRIEHQDDDVSGFNGLQGLDDRKLFDRFKNAAFAAYTGRINQLIFFIAALKFNFNGVTRGPRLVKRNDPLFTQ